MIQIVWTFQELHISYSKLFSLMVELRALCIRIYDILLSLKHVSKHLSSCTVIQNSLSKKRNSSSEKCLN